MVTLVGFILSYGTIARQFAEEVDWENIEPWMDRLEIKTNFTYEKKCLKKCLSMRI